MFQWFCYKKVALVQFSSPPEFVFLLGCAMGDCRVAFTCSKKSMILQSVCHHEKVNSIGVTGILVINWFYRPYKQKKTMVKFMVCKAMSNWQKQIPICITCCEKWYCNDNENNNNHCCNNNNDCTFSFYNHTIIYLRILFPILF